MGFLDKLLGRKKPSDQPQTAPPPASMPESDKGTTAPAAGEGEGEHRHEGEPGHEH
jgi:hypothetical protein